MRKIGKDRHYDPADINNMGTGIANIVRDQVDKHNDSSKVYLAGISQGAMMSLYVQMNRLGNPIGGVGVFEGSLVPPLMELLDKSVTN